MLSLAAIGIALGVALLLILRRVSNQEAIRGTRRQLQACLYELRLFVDEPRLAWRAQMRLLRLNARYLTLMLRPLLVLTVPMIILFSVLEPFYGKAPLPIGKAAIVSVKLLHPALTGAPVLQTPAGINVETPAVRMQGARQIAWRIRAGRATSGLLRIVFPNEIATKKIASGPHPAFLSTRRVRLSWQFLLHPTEHPLPTGNVEWIVINYPPRTMEWLGLNLPWFIWLFLFSTITAIALLRPLRIAV